MTWSPGLLYGSYIQDNGYVIMSLAANDHNINMAYLIT